MKIIVAVEDSQYSHCLIEELTRRSWPKDTAFKILTVIEPISHLTLSLSHAPDVYRTAQAQEHLRHAAEKNCASFRQKLLEHIDDSIVHFEVREGHVKDEIIESAAQWGADKIILGANTGLATEQKSTGGTCKTVVHHAPCAVEIVVPASHRRAKKAQSELVLQ
jgi:nucleotide-binding universal stress UspA family protein